MVLAVNYRRIVSKPKFLPPYIPECYDNDKAINAIFEIRHLWEYVVEEATFNYSEIYQIRYISETELAETFQKYKENFAVYDIVKNCWLIKPSENESAYKYCYDGENFVDFHIAKTKKTGCRHLLVGKFTTLMQEQNLLKCTSTSASLLNTFVKPCMKLIVGVPGCGKTTYIIDNHWEGSLVLTSCAEGAADIRSRMSKKTGLRPDTFRRSYRTIDSYLLHSRERYSCVWMDEALMEHPGKLFLVCLFTRCTHMYMLGDPNQLGYINRVDSVKLLYDKSAMFFKPSTILNISYRCPVDVMARLSKNYDGGAYSESKVLCSLKCITFTSLEDVPNLSDTKYLVFKQVEKKEMKVAGYDVSTVHEFQGKEAEHVIVVRMSRNLNEELYESPAHILVAISRHRRSLVYFTPVTDGLKKLMETPVYSSNEMEHWKSTHIPYIPNWLLPNSHKTLTILKVAKLIFQKCIAFVSKVFSWFW